MHEGDEPDVLVDLPDADVLARQYRGAEIDFAPLCQADAAALRDRQGAVMEGVAKLIEGRRRGEIL